MAIFTNAQHMYTTLSVEKIAGLTKAFESLILQSYLRHRDAFFQRPTTSEYLGNGTWAIYRFVRGKLGVPLHRGPVEQRGAGNMEGNGIDGRPKKTIGSWVSIIYEAVRDGSLYAEVFRFPETTRA